MMTLSSSSLLVDAADDVPTSDNNGQIMNFLNMIMQLPKKILDAIMKRFGWLNEIFYNMANNSKHSVEMIENNERISRLKLWIRSNDPLAKFVRSFTHRYHPTI